MALPIAATPTLRGKEAIKFQKQATKNKSKFASKKEVIQAIKSFNKIVNAGTI